MTEPTPEETTGDEEPTLVLVTLTCHTEGCTNAGIALEMYVPDTTTAAVCGACGQAITDVQGLPDGPPA